MSATTPTQDATAGSSTEAQAAEPEAGPTIYTPPFPFSKNPQADLVIRAADGGEFQVIKAILAAASSVFEDMFIVAQPSPAGANDDDDDEDDDDDDETEALPTVDVTEDSTTLEYLLRFCYPVPTPSLPSLTATAAVLEASRKYAVVAAQAGCAAHLARLAPASPARAMQVYALACLFGRESLARAAAPHTLGLSLDALLTGAFPEAEALPFACVPRLAAFRRECAATLAPLAAPAHWIVDPRQAAQGQSGLVMPWVRPRTDKPNACCEEFTHERRGLWGNVETVFVKKWWWDYMNEMAVALAHIDKDGRRKSEEGSARDRAVTSAVLCETCRPAAFKEFKVFEEKLQHTLDAAVTKAAAKYYFTTKAPTQETPRSTDALANLARFLTNGNMR